MPVFVCIPCKAFFVTAEEGEPCRHCGGAIQEANPAEVHRFFERLRRQWQEPPKNPDPSRPPGSGNAN